MVPSLSQVIKNLQDLGAGKKSGKLKGGTGKIAFKSLGEKWPSTITKDLNPRQKRELSKGRALVAAENSSQQIWLVQGQNREQKSHYGYFSPSPYTMARDLMASAFRQSLGAGIGALEIQYFGKNPEEFVGLVVGVEMSSYNFSDVWPRSQTQRPKLHWKSSLKNHKALVKAGRATGSAANIARFLVDLPPNVLNPDSYAKMATQVFKGQKGIKCSVWNHSRLAKENMGLHLAVGQASENPSCMIQIAYRAPGCKEKPCAFVGKGVTFDSGGLDIKPGSSMRLMKKDMGGSASVFGLAHWVMQTRPKINCDFYLAVAENSIAGNAFRPGDILTAKNGSTVEIHNTDAEGRLVLGDTLTVAASKKPKWIIDVATLTGAIKYGLGADTPGLFSNDDALAERLMRSTQRRGETAWRMPLVPGERARLRSDVADMVNCTDGFGGAVTAALFLESFVEDIPWAHFDIYGWTGKARGVFRHSGGNGQLVQALAEFLCGQEMT